MSGSLLCRGELLAAPRITELQLATGDVCPQCSAFDSCRTRAWRQLAQWRAQSSERSHSRVDVPLSTCVLSPGARRLVSVCEHPQAKHLRCDTSVERHSDTSSRPSACASTSGVISPAQREACLTRDPIGLGTRPPPNITYQAKRDWPTNSVHQVVAQPGRIAPAWTHCTRYQVGGWRRHSERQ